MLRWPGRRRSDKDPTPAAPEDDELRAAEEALEGTEQQWQEVRERTSEIREIARTLRRLGERNHFAPLVSEAFGGKGQ